MDVAFTYRDFRSVHCLLKGFVNLAEISEYTIHEEYYSLLQYLADRLERRFSSRVYYFLLSNNVLRTKRRIERTYSETQRLRNDYPRNRLSTGFQYYLRTYGYEYHVARFCYR